MTRKNLLTISGLLLPILSICCTAARADGLLKGSAEVRVSPMDELTVIDPGVNSTGKPEPVVADGQVETAPTIIVHNYYYTGDRDFRGPVLKGGPCILVIEHPYTCERLYLDVQMLPGSPRIVYRKCAIEYHFGKHDICIQLHNPANLLHPNRPVVRNGLGSRWIQQARYTNRTSTSREWLEKTGIPDAFKSASSGTKALVDRSAEGLRRTGEIVTTPIKAVAESTALGSLFEPSPEDEPRFPAN